MNFYDMNINKSIQLATRMFFTVIGLVVELSSMGQTYVNPVLGGDHPDPTVVRVGADYYMTHSSFEYLPGLTIYHSRDLVNWEPIASALHENLGSVWAPDISRHKGLYYIYFTTSDGHDHFHNYVITARNPAGPWSNPIDLHIGGAIDPCHVADQTTGKRWLFLSGGLRIGLADDGRSTVGKAEKVYSGWTIPQDWIVEGMALEGPKIRKIGDYYYWISAEGGTAGPATTHMAVVARSESIDGPWENMPANPLIHTWSAGETWWSKGHASLIDTPAGQWYALYHAYDKSRLNQGRQMLIEPVRLTADGWLEAPTGVDADKPLPVPFTGTAQHKEMARRLPLLRIGKEWRGTLAFDSTAFSVTDRALMIQASGITPATSSLLLFTAPDRNYEVRAVFENTGEVESGLVFYYNEHYFAGFGCGQEKKTCWRRGEKRDKGRHGLGSRLWIKVRFQDNVVTGYLSGDGTHWSMERWGMEMSGYQHNILSGFMSLLPGIYCLGKGAVTVSHFQYKPL